MRLGIIANRKGLGRVLLIKYRAPHQTRYKALKAGIVKGDPAELFSADQRIPNKCTIAIRTRAARQTSELGLRDS